MFLRGSGVRYISHELTYQSFIKQFIIVMIMYLIQQVPLVLLKVKHHLIALMSIVVI